MDNPSRWSRAAGIATGLALVLWSGLILLRLLTHHPFYDELIHARYLWLISQGLAPHRDFWCTYPVPGYVPVLARLRALPESAYALFGLRLVSLALLAVIGILLGQHSRRVAGDGRWGLASLLLLTAAPGISAFVVEYSLDPLAAAAAVGAMVLLFAEPAPRRFGAAVGLAGLSVMIMPKYLLPLAGGLGMAFLALALRRRLPAAVVAGAAGTAGAFAVILLLYLGSGTTLIEDWRWTHILSSRYTFVHPRGGLPLWRAFLGTLAQNPLWAVLGAAGLAGWVRQARASRNLAGAGIAAGALASLLLVHTFLEQYILPVMLCVALFAPYAALLFSGPRARSIAFAVLAAGLALTTAYRLAGALPELRETIGNTRNPANTKRLGRMAVPPAYKSLRATQRLLKIIPPGERVIATWEDHPVFRRDLTFMTADYVPSYADLLPPGDPVRRYFSTEYLREELEAHPPAMISLYRLDQNYPPGWQEVCREFLAEHAEEYGAMMLRDRPLFIRRDIVEPAGR